MTYGRARLCLGITGVGSLVSFSAIALALNLPGKWLESQPGLGLQGFLQLLAVTGAFIIWLTPFDFLGGYLLPQKFNKSTEAIDGWLRRYLTAVIQQGLLFVSFGSIIVFVGQKFGVLGGLIVVSLFMLACFLGRNRIMLNRKFKSEASSEKLLDAISMIQTWQIYVPRTVIVEHVDVGFTGGVIGFGKDAKIVIPRAWLAFGTEQLATAIARRAVAVSNGSYTRGLILAFLWNLAGFSLSALLTGANLASVAGLVTVLCGFTLWSFFGLLILPTVSRTASLRVDEELVERGMPFDLISRTASSMDRLQDNEPERPGAIETIFHPVPSVNGRKRNQPVKGFAAWNVARTTLFFSWACLGVLSRSVHCNVGRPELWLMLPTD